MKRVVRAVTSLLLVAIMASPACAGEINLAVAASLKEVINELGDGFAKKHQGVRLVKNYGASGQLAKQIESGMTADIFISANPEWMDYLINKRLVERGRSGVFTYNTLVFAGAPGRAASMRELLKLERIAIGSPRSVPAGEYAMEAMQKAGLVKLLEKKLVMAKDVRECLMYAERGEVDGGFVYRTDALQARKVGILFTVPQELYPKVVYPMALTMAGARNNSATQFFAYLQSGEARAVLARYGFAAR
jgi:molybdate transport system substrate-binding protein